MDRGLECHPCRRLHRVAEGPCRDSREGDGTDLVLLRQFERTPIARGQQLVSRLIHAVDRPETVNHIPIGEILCTGDHRLPRSDGGQRTALLCQPWTRRPMNRAGHTAAHLQLTVGRVDGSLHVGLLRDIALHALKRDSLNFAFRDELTTFPDIAHPPSA